ncbi:hypothetical protein Q8F55_007028 [Vanrija albida]|uniref:RING-type domain-containing protein n=1 Tax=Vanrija albida TaxID=181172 RepID=A0ABR3PYM6_9TREE
MRPRLEDVACAICMDSLFTAKDDLDEVLPVAAPDCGHVLHEKCLLSWFDSQIQAFLATARERGWDGDGDPGPNDAPVECPQCRTEVYGDDDGKPLIHRLYVNFEGASSTQQHSSPMGPRASQHWGNPVEREALSLARRAKGAAEELGELGARSSVEDINGTAGRVQKLQEDMLSAKASQAFKKYIGGLTVAINSLRDRLETDPTIPGLQAEMARLKAARTSADQRASRMETIGIPQAHQAGVMDERKRAERVVRQAQMERDAIQREVDKEKVARESYRRAAEEREAELRRLLDKANASLQQAKTQNDDLRKTVVERTGSLKIARSKLEARRGLKDRLAGLEEENARLQQALKRPPRPLPGPSFSTPPQQPGYDDEDDLGMAGTPSPIAFTYSKPTHLRPTPDDSLLVEEPFDAALGLDFGTKTKSRSTTARSFKMDLDNGLVKDKEKRSKSKYFDKAPPRPRSPSPSPAPSPKVLIPDSSPLRRPSPKRAARAERYSPVSRPVRHGTSTADAIELSPSPVRAGPLRTIKRDNARQPNFLQDAGLVDAHGRPRKTLATGVRVRPGKL